MGPDLHVVQVDQLDPRLGRQVVHDQLSRRFALGATVDRSLWRSTAIRVYDPQPNPNQPVGCCIGCDKAMNFNAAGSRQVGRVLTMEFALAAYSLATRLDPFDGVWQPTDTGSSGLAACQAAQRLGVGGEYRWLFGGADEVVQALMEGSTVGLGTWWYEGGFDLKPIAGGGLGIDMTGKRVGGHQWRARAYDKRRDLIGGRCWWGRYRDFWIPRSQVQDLLADDGDAHVQLLPRPAA